MKSSLIATSLLLGLSVAAAQARITPQSIIVNPAPADLKVQVWVDRDQSGNNTPNYAVGDRIRIYTSVSDDAYVYLFNVNPDGSVDQILPNRYASGANFVKANTVKVFPGAQDRFTFDIAGPYGVNKVLALASKTQLNLNQVSSFKNNEAFATVNVRGQENFAQALSIVVNPVPRESWITDVVYYNVVSTNTAGNQPTTVIVSPQPSPVAVIQPAPRAGTTINIDITIRPFSGAQNVQTYNENAAWRSEFSSSARLDGVYGYYDGELRSQGYRLVERKARGNQVEGRYLRGQEEMKLKVKQTGPRFEVSIERGR